MTLTLQVPDVESATDPNTLHPVVLGALDSTEILREAAKTRAVVVVEHDMDFVRRLNCKVTVLHEGSVLAEGSIDHVTANSEVIEVYLGR